MNQIINFSVRLTQRYLPDAYILAIILTVLVFFFGIVFTDNSVIQMTEYWGEGFSALFTFGMQMTLVLITGYSLARTPAITKFLQKITDIPNTSGQAIALVALVSIISCYFSWAFGLVVGAILAKEMGKRHPKMHFPLIVAAAYGGEIIRGPSSSIPLVVATPEHFMEDKIGIIPASQTLFSSWNIVITLLIIVAVVFLFTRIKVHPDDVIPFKEELEQPTNQQVSSQHTDSFAEKIEQSRWMNWLLALLPLLYLGNLIFTGQFSLNLNVVILMFLTLTLLLSASAQALLDMVKEAVMAARGIILQFPLYAGIAGMMASSGLVDQIAQSFIHLSNANTFPVMTFFSAGIVNFFIPSGGGQWAIYFAHHAGGL